MNWRGVLITLFHSLTHFGFCAVCESCKGCWVDCTGLRWGLGWAAFSSPMDGLAERKGTADNDAEGTSFLSGSGKYSTRWYHMGKQKHMYDYQLHLYAVSRVACGAVWPQYLGLCSSAWGWWQAGARSHLDSEQSQWSLCSWLCWSSGLQARPRSAKAPSSAEISPAAVAQNIIISINLELNKVGLKQKKLNKK